MKIFIAVPSMDTVPALFCQSLALLQRAGDTVIGFEVGSLMTAGEFRPLRRATTARAVERANFRESLTKAFLPTPRQIKIKNIITKKKSKK